MSEKKDEIEELVASILRNPKLLDEVASALSGASRRARQNAAVIMSAVAKEKPELVLPYHNEIIDALNRPEARTRWECLDALTMLVDVESRSCDKAISGAEASLFDEESGPVRLAALRFLCKIGATTELRSEKTWPLIDEALQCYHGDLEYGDMLAAVTEYAQGKLTADVKQQLIDRVSFDATNSKGWLQRRSQQIIDLLQ